MTISAILNGGFIPGNQVLTRRDVRATTYLLEFGG